MNLLTIAHTPPIQVSPNDSVMEAVDVSLPAKVGAVTVVEGGKLVGIFTERDLMFKVVHQRLNVDKTLVGEVMTSPVTTIAAETPVEEVLRMMLDKHIRHLPISEDGMVADGMLSIRNVLQSMVVDLQNNLRHLENYIGADGPGG